MNSIDAARLSDAIARNRHPRSDYRTEEAESYTDRLRPFFEQVIFPGCRALDLGCSSGKFTFAMEQHGARPVGLDCSAEAIAFAKEIACAEQSNPTGRAPWYSMAKVNLPDEQPRSSVRQPGKIACSKKGRSRLV